ncbi:MAG: D-alanine--D-alanine ligase [Nocardioides sp.]|uniref:D-alanine--D-alanine ligase family protein n=1 Tax=Nocardioides sp. TaxID=35761 RepID=UPI002392E3F5|nr:D-alanine--D-alanine ligase family protein [Nocardioides sp.]MDE0774894.1 D-alanine--D-alanine ligase [Nocardioides sp.]
MTGSDRTPDPSTAPRTDGRPRVAVVFGGRSSEHGISCVTAGSVLAAIEPTAYDVVAIGIARDGRWVLEQSGAERWSIAAGDASQGEALLPSVDGGRPTVTLTQAASGTDLLVSEASRPPEVLGEVDVVFPVLHGPWGEDGTIQGMLEMAGVRYVGAGVLASAVSMDKAYMKVVLAAAGLPVMPGITVTAAQWAADADAVRRRVADLQHPVFVKPARGGSSMGVAKVGGAGELDAALAEAFEHDPRVLVEVSAQEAREVECGVLQRLDGGCETTRPAEIHVDASHDFYDFEAKYLPDQATEIDLPADLPVGVEEQVRSLSARAFEAVGCEGLARVDFFVQGDGSLIVNEINTMPGFTPTSMFPQMWAESGLDYPALVDRLLQLALQRGTGLR